VTVAVTVAATVAVTVAATVAATVAVMMSARYATTFQLRDDTFRIAIPHSISEKKKNSMRNRDLYSVYLFAGVGQLASCSESCSASCSESCSDEERAVRRDLSIAHWLTRHYAMDELQWNHISGACCSMLQCGAVSCRVLQCVAVCCTGLRAITPWMNCSGIIFLVRVAVCCSVVLSAAVCCSVLQCVVLAHALLRHG